MRRRLCMLAILALTCPHITGCDRDTDSTPAPTQTDETTPPSSTPTEMSGSASALADADPDADTEATAWETPTPDVDEDLMTALSSITKACRLADGLPTQCSPDAARRRAEATLEDAGLAALPTLAAALSRRGEATGEYAAYYLQEKLVPDHFEDARAEQIDATATRRLLEALRRLDAARATKAARVTALATAARGELDDLWEVVRDHPHSEVAAHAVRWTMVLGDLTAFDRITTIATDDAAPTPVRAAALQAPLEMNTWSDVEAAKICSWNDTHLSTLPTPLEEWSARIALRCGGDSVTRLLDHAESKLEDGYFGASFTRNLLGLCDVGAATGQTADACARFQGLLADAATKKSLDASKRTSALGMLIAMRPDDDRTEAIVAEILANEDAPEALRAIAQRFKKTAAPPE